MAKVAPYFDLKCSSTNAWKGYVNYTLTDDPANNRTKVSAELWAYKDDGYKSGGNNPLFAPTITINGTTYGTVNDRYTTESTTHHSHLTVSDVYVNHNSDGTKTLTISGNVTKLVDSSDYSTNLDGKSITGSTTLTLTSYVTGYTLTYNANGGSGAPSSVSGVKSTTISSVTPTRSGYNFLGWSTSSSATSASYVAGDSISLSSNTTLYAVWAKFYIVTYNANGGSNAPYSDKKLYGETLTLTRALPTPPENTSATYTVILDANGGTCDVDMMTVDNVVTYEFSHWNTSSDGTGRSYQSGESYTSNANITLYAQYDRLTFHQPITLPTPTRTGYEFLGWSTGTGNVTGEYAPTGNITLCAVWELNGLVHICDSAGTFSPYKVLIYDGSGWNQYVPYIYTESGWTLCS